MGDRTHLKCIKSKKPEYTTCFEGKSRVDQEDKASEVRRETVDGLYFSTIGDRRGRIK